MKIVIEKQVGYPVTYKGNRDRTKQLEQWPESRVYPKGFGFEARARLIETRYQICHRVQDAERAIQGALTSQVMRTLWPTGANMRSKEIVLAVLVKGHRTDLVQVWVYQALTALKNDAQEQHGTWIPLWRQMGSHAEEKSQTRYRGVGGQR